MHPSKVRIYVFDWNTFIMALGIILSLCLHLSTQSNIAERDKKI